MPYTKPAPRPSVLQVSAFFPLHGGGIEVVAGRLAQGLADEGITVFWMAGGPTSERYVSTNDALLIEQAISIDLFERKLGLPSPIWNLSSLSRLWFLVRRVDLLQVHDYLYLPTLFAMIFARLMGKPIVLTQHIGMIPFKSRTARLLLQALNRTLGWLVMRSVSQVVFVGKPVQEYFEFFSSFQRPARLISNGVDHDLFVPNIERKATDQVVHCLFVGRFVEKKGLALLRECVELPGIRWTFVGWGPLSPLTWPVLPASVTVLDKLPPEQLPALFQAADLLVLPSTGEGFPLVVQESLASGTPVLVSSEVARAFPETDPACVFDVDLDVALPAQALRGKLQSISEDLSALQAARCNAVRLAGQWSWGSCVSQYAQEYARFISEK